MVTSIRIGASREGYRPSTCSQRPCRKHERRDHRRTRPPGIDPRRLQVAPDDPRLRGDRSAASQCRHPRIGRAGEARADDLRVGLEQRSIAACVPDNPARADFDRPSTEDRHGEGVSIGDLPVRRTRTGAHVADRVPALGDDQPPSCAVEQPAVGREPRVEGAGRQFKRTGIPTVTRKPEYQLLDAEVACVRRLLVHVAAKFNAERDVERHGDSLPRVEGVAAAQTAFDRRHR